jgi:hypothetical protein
MGLSLPSGAQPTNRNYATRGVNNLLLNAARQPTVKQTTLALLGAIFLALGAAAPALAYPEIQPVPGFSNYYPWFNEVPQDPGPQSFRYFLAYHPYIAAALSHNPGLLYSAGWRSQQPALEQYLENHPYVWQELNGPYWAEGPAQTQWGYYDDQHQWRDAYWWHLNQPNWFYNNHQQWSSLDSRWLSQDGAYDNQHQWHYGEWWYNQNPAWVASNHPGWLQQHHDWENASEQQKYRQQQGMNQPGAARNEQQASLDRRELQTQQLNQQRRANIEKQPESGQQNQRQVNQQRQASLEQQHEANVQQEQATQQNRQAATQQRQAKVQQRAMREETQQNQERANQEQSLENRQQEKDHQQQNQQRATGEQRADARQQESMRQENSQPQHEGREQAPASHEEHQQVQQQQHGQGGGNHNQH